MKSIIIALITLLLLTSVASAATLNVGPHEKYTTIQKAVNAAHSGDTIQVSKGTYKEYVKVTGKYLNIYGQKSGGSYTKYPAVYGFDMYAGGNCTIDGFYFTKKGISIHDGSMSNVIQNNYFTNCGVDISGNTASDNLIKNNKITGGTISLIDTFGSVITGCTITKSNVGICLIEPGDSIVSNNVISYNKIGILIFNGCGDIKKNNVFKGNEVNIKNVDF